MTTLVITNKPFAILADGYDLRVASLPGIGKARFAGARPNIMQ